jgi:hypothetical protein
MLLNILSYVSGEIFWRCLWKRYYFSFWYYLFQL